MEPAYEAAILNKICYILLKISELKAEINNLHLERESLLSGESNIICDETN